MALEFVLEVGTEELPASFVAHALASLREHGERLLNAHRLAPASAHAMGTPRRLAWRMQGLPQKQAERAETVLGPSWSVAFNEDGSPKKAAEGFAKKHGVPIDALTKKATDKGDYVSVDIRESGRATTEVLAEILPALCSSITFPKSMRWGDGETPFGRPIHWIVALLDDKVVPFKFAGVASGRTTRGHRFLAPKSLALEHAHGYEKALEAAHVIVDVERRREKMNHALLEAASAVGGVLQKDPFLIDECVSLVEEPFVVAGSFDPAFLELPDSVVVAVMRDHQRYFAVRKPKSGELLPAYLNVVNTALDPKTIAKGNDRVLRARLADAKFFVDEDRKAPLESRLAKLASVVFQSKLGTMGQKVDRIERLSRQLASTAGVDAERCATAARLSKADLETLIVYEFPELQGEMGRWYALQEGLDPEVADAVRDHYRPQGADDALPASKTSAIVAIADRIDTLVGCFGVGLVPTGSADPFALRRAALGIVRIALEGPLDVDLRSLIAAAYQEYENAAALRPVADVTAALDDFFRARIRALLRERHPGDVVDACLGAWDGTSIRDLQARIQAVSDFRALPEYQALAVAFKRAFNITKESGRGAVDPKLLESGPETALARSFETVRAKVDEATTKHRYADALKIVAHELGAPIDRYFEEVFVMVDDPKVRDNRLRLLGDIADTVNRIAHFHQLST